MNQETVRVKSKREKQVMLANANMWNLEKWYE